MYKQHYHLGSLVSRAHAFWARDGRACNTNLRKRTFIPSKYLDLLLENDGRVTTALDMFASVNTLCLYLSRQTSLTCRLSSASVRCTRGPGGNEKSGATGRRIFPSCAAAASSFAQASSSLSPLSSSPCNAAGPSPSVPPAPVSSSAEASPVLLSSESPSWSSSSSVGSARLASP